MDQLVKKKAERFFVKDVETDVEPKRLRGLLNPTRWEILKKIAEKPNYPSQIARHLRLDEQIVYYHIRELLKNKLIEIEKTEMLGGAMAKYYRPTARVFALELPGGEERLAEFPIKKQPQVLKDFLNPFIVSGKFNAKIIVGSPDPHGKYQVRARDSHYAIDLAMFIGQFVELPQNNFIVKLDIDVKSENFYDNNLILVGGILTNTITEEFNNYLPAKFQSEKFPFRGIISEKTGDKYVENAQGIIAKIPNPKFPDKKIIVLAGNTFNGTKATVIGLTRFYEKVLSDYKNEDTWVKVIQGLDMNGDGKIDFIKVLE